MPLIEQIHNCHFGQTDYEMALEAVLAYKQANTNRNDAVLVRIAKVQTKMEEPEPVGTPVMLDDTEITIIACGLVLTERKHRFVPRNDPNWVDSKHDEWNALLHRIEKHLGRSISY